MQTALLYVVITALMAGVLVGFAVPFLILAWIVYRVMAGRLGDSARLALVAAVVAIGVAPSYDAYMGPLPIWVRLWRGEPVTLLAALVSLALTWLTFMALARLVVARRRPAHA